MVTAQLDLWPAAISPQVDLNSPLSILREQAALLEKKTNGIVKAEVRTSKKDATGNPAFEYSHQAFNLKHSFYLLAPSLDQYRYHLFQIVQPVDMYPLKIADSPIGNADVESEEQLIDVLRKIFASEKTQRIIQALIAQSLSAPNEDGIPF